MKKEFLLQRMNEIQGAIKDSLDNYNKLKTMLDSATNAHNSLVGRLEEANELYKALEKEEAEKPIESHVAE